MNVSLRTMQLSDADAVIELNKSVVELTSPMDSVSFEKLFRMNGVCLVAEKDNKVVAFVMCVKDNEHFE